MTRSTELHPGQLIVAGFPGPDLPTELGKSLEESSLGGVIFFRRNTGDLRGVAAINARLSAMSPLAPPFVCVDQEGGRVARLGPPVLKLPPMRVLGELDRADLTRQAAVVLGRHLRALGFNLDFAPVLDVNTRSDNPVIGDRAFGSTPERVTRHALAFAEGLALSGIASCGKHFPGHGDTEVDSHLELPRVIHDRARLEAVELGPFRAAAKVLPSMMTAHVVLDAIDEGVPSTLSEKVVTGMLRRDLAYDGVVFSDDLEMKAITGHYGIGDAACRAVEAGCDALLVCSRWDFVCEAREALERRVRDDTVFAQRVRTAQNRCMRLRSALGADRSAIDFERIVDDDEARRLERTLADAISASS